MEVCFFVAVTGTGSPNAMSPPTITRDTRIQRVDNVLHTEVEGELVVMDIHGGLYFGLDAIGTDIWYRLEKPMTVVALAASLSEDYEADAATIEHDVLVLLADLAERGLVEIC
jgi:hypothetical protein